MKTLTRIDGVFTNPIYVADPRTGLSQDSSAEAQAALTKANGGPVTLEVDYVSPKIGRVSLNFRTVTEEQRAAEEANLYRDAWSFSQTHSAGVNRLRGR